MWSTLINNGEAKAPSIILSPFHQKRFAEHDHPHIPIRMLISDASHSSDVSLWFHHYSVKTQQLSLQSLVSLIDFTSLPENSMGWEVSVHFPECLEKKKKKRVSMKNRLDLVYRLLKKFQLKNFLGSKHLFIIKKISAFSLISKFKFSIFNFKFPPKFSPHNF